MTSNENNNAVRFLCVFIRAELDQPINSLITDLRKRCTNKKKIKEIAEGK